MAPFKYYAAHLQLLKLLCCAFISSLVQDAPDHGLTQQPKGLASQVLILMKT